MIGSKCMLCILAFTVPAFAQQEPIQCTSTGAPVTCRADTFFGVLIAHEMSDHRCVQGKTWRYDAEGIYVSKGCSAEFLVNPRHSNAFGDGGYKVYGSGKHAFHTNGAIKPGSNAPDSNTQNTSGTPTEHPQ